MTCSIHYLHSLHPHFNKLDERAHVKFCASLKVVAYHVLPTNSYVARGDGNLLLVQQLLQLPMLTSQHRVILHVSHVAYA